MCPRRRRPIPRHAGFAFEQDRSKLVGIAPALRHVAVAPYLELAHLDTLPNLAELLAPRAVPPPPLAARGAGLVALVERWLGRRIDKRQQVGDWERRPLLPAQRDYAGTRGGLRPCGTRCRAHADCWSPAALASGPWGAWDAFADDACAADRAKCATPSALSTLSARGRACCALPALPPLPRRRSAKWQQQQQQQPRCLNRRLKTRPVRRLARPRTPSVSRAPPATLRLSWTR